MHPEQRSSEANRITWISVIWESLLTLFKLFAGIVGHSSAIIADAFHSLSDLASDIVLLISFRYVKKPVDENHHYGHGKIETLSAIFISIMILAAAGAIFWGGYRKIIHVIQGGLLPKPGWIAAVAALSSIFVKEILYYATLRVGKRINSQAVIANAWHHRSDSFSSIAALIGITGSILLNEFWRILDPIAAILVGILLVRIAVLLSKEGLAELMETSLNSELNDTILNIVESVPGANNPHNLKTRKIGNAIAIDLHIKVKPTLSIVDAHDIATQVEHRLREKFGPDTFISVHTEPGVEQESRS